ncbi:C45 family autoproteolytic acyltransferase/hydrolase [Aquibacillus sp. 3ASR75-11]|uniref:C45 family autoproteolytic acyltransferase/hydrolase n=1 Tax=Terrihalobacillus insolitus TaxID=2950438 RepID=A0A9X3WQX2_9BACI|nr:C45 family peptidase [Terrihalobacillus insolitus]MDC3414055.1 C45 family autoproteolytic acyltransferase/hydrolase [Terrihalobacillus insolitus]MDC3424145.1 C45 family autoproteolytic acyltransferase/hydrolase [Terrihalobacillus insolitus]
MKQIYSNIIQFRGTHYDFGYMQGKQLKNSLTVLNREKQWKVRKPRFLVEEQEAKDAISRFAPGVWEELIGIQDGLEWPIERVLMEFGGYRLDYVRSGCSILTGADYLLRNYDYHPKTYEGRYVFYQPTDQGYAMVGPSQRVTGRSDGMNEMGLVMGYNFMHRKHPGDGFICCMIGRLVLESCANVEEAVTMLKEIPHRHSFSYIVYDKSGKTYIVEASPRGVEVRQSTVCTNHFEIMQNENRNHLLDSIRRKELIEKKQEDMIDAYEAFRLLNDTDKGVFSKQYRSWAGTIHTSAYFPQQMKTWMVLGGDQEPNEFDFMQWLTGEDIIFDQIMGAVDTNLPFVHMDENASWGSRG